VTGVVAGAEAPIVVFLQSDDENPTRYYDGYQTATDKNGIFSFEGITPGNYHLWAQAPGFMPAGSADDGGIKITLQRDEHRTDVTVAMIHRRALCGRVTENGTALARPTWVTAFRYDPNLGTLTKTFLPRTKEDGSYRFGDLEPGAYYL
jgi:protocatechuate 3,4-dioxygenase beta subunit